MTGTGTGPSRELRLEVDGLLFDSDGVLVDSHAQVDAAWRTLAHEFELDYDVLAEQLVGVPARATLERHLADHRLVDAVARIDELEIATATTTLPILGAIELLDALPTDRWAIVTSASLALGSARWLGAGLPPAAQVITADDVTRGKPSPDPFLAGARLLGVDPRRCVVFEDSASGGDAAAAAEATPIAVGALPWRYTPAGRISDLTRVTVVDVTPTGVVLSLRVDDDTIG